jgi:MFS family permease
VNERRSPNPMLPLAMFRQRQFAAANLETFLVYAALGGLFFFLVIQLQVVAGFSAVLAGSALLPVTFIMLLLSARSGALSTSIGPRLPMSLGPIIAAVGVVLLLRIGPDASYTVDVLPGVTVIGLGLALMVAPLTMTVLAAVESEHAGVASGINNAVARAAGLLAVALLPLIAGISGDDYQQPQAFAEGFSIAMLTCAVLLLAGGLTAAVLIQKPRAERMAGPPARRQYCAVDGPPLHPAASAVPPARG